MTARLGLFALATAGALGCREAAPSASPPEPQPAAVAPLDHLAAGELPEGEGRAFGLALPRGVRGVTQLTRQVIAETDATPEDVSNYFRARVADGKITVGTTSTRFIGVRAKRDPTRQLDIYVDKTKTGTQIYVADVTQPKGPPPVSQSEALKRVGLSPSGTPRMQ